MLPETEVELMKISQPEKHLLSQGAVDTLLDGPVAEGVQKFRTPLGYTLSRTL